MSPRKAKPEKPRADFPLFAHASGQWRKKSMIDFVFPASGLSQTTETDQTARGIEVSALDQHCVHLIKLLAHNGLTPKNSPEKAKSDAGDDLRDMVWARGDMI